MLDIKMKYINFSKFGFKSFELFGLLGWLVEVEVISFLILDFWKVARNVMELKYVFENLFCLVLC